MNGPVWCSHLVPAALLAFAVGITPAADWTCSSGEAYDTLAGRCTMTLWSLPADRGGRAFSSTSLVLATCVRVQVVEQRAPDKEQAASVADLMAANGAVAAINGGYFTKEFAPAGLLVIDGREVSPRSSEIALSGVLAIDAAGLMSVRLRDDSLTGAAYARQAGPFLIDPTGIIGIKQSERPAFARRSVVVVATDGHLAFVATTEVSLYDLATNLHDHAKGFGIAGVERALNLDGGPSTALCVAGLPKPSVFSEKAPVRDALVVVAP